MRRLINAFRHSWDGLAYAFRTQAAFRQEILLLAVGSALAFMADVSALHRLALIGSLLLVLIAELINTAMETIIDRIGTERHPLSGHAKDIGSAIVLLSLGFAALTWALVFLA